LLAMQEVLKDADFASRGLSPIQVCSSCPAGLPSSPAMAEWIFSLTGQAKSVQKLYLKDTIIDGELVYFAGDCRRDFDELKK
jgi:hypothetical protein